MKILSPAFSHNDFIPKKFTCDGANINPALIFSEIPANAQSLVLIMEDPDVPKNIRSDGLWIHWMIWDMPIEVKEIQENSMPKGIVGKNTSGTFSYSSPCPPDKEHRYFFKLYALDTILNLNPETNYENLKKAMESHILDKAELIGRYLRS